MKRFTGSAARLLIVLIPLASALVFFMIKYQGDNPFVIVSGKSVRRVVFLRTFYISFVLFALTLPACLFSANINIRRFYLAAGIIAAVLSVHILEDFLSINLFVYLAYITMIIIVFPPPKNGFLSALAAAIFLFFMNHPPFLGLSLGGASFARPSFLQCCTLVLVLFFLTACMILLRFFMEKYRYTRKTVEHLNFVSTKLLLFNHHLQELAKKSGKEAIKQERLRFTRELHDSCGYAFSNIILVSDAAISRNEMDAAYSQEIFHKIRALASKGLNDTRETLRLIRKIQEPYHSSVETVHQLKKIFEEVTGIRVAVEWGNMKNDYGEAVNRTLTRIIQEAFTNSIRHGKASLIQIQFWESHVLTMTVTDNGIGAVNIVQGIGLAGMAERLALVGGGLSVSSPPEGGFRVRITIPLV